MTWLHWTATGHAVPGSTKLGCWLLTVDGLTAKGAPQPIRRIDVGLADMAFVMDVKLRDEARRLNRTRNHLWAVGTLLEECPLGREDAPGWFHLERYDWKNDEGISVDGCYIDGAEIFVAGIRSSDGRPDCFVYRPRWR